MTPHFREHQDGTFDLGIYGDYAGASMTAYAFDRQFPGLGKWLVMIAAWLFALSTMISWSYYGEQGIYYFTGLFGDFGSSIEKTAVLLYKVIYSLLILLTTVLAMPFFGPDKKPFIATDHELDMWTTLGLGVMLVANIPIMWIFGAKAMGAYHEYFRRMKAGGDPPHDAPPIKDVVEGKDVE
jgi:AGCS family alanine or glycine:cation symporter